MASAPASDLTARLTEQLSALGEPGLYLANVWLALWSALSGRRVVRAQWGFVPLPRLAAGRLIAQLADPLAAAVAIVLAVEKDPNAAERASKSLESLERDGLLETPARGIATEIVVAIIGGVVTVIATGAGAYRANQEKQAAEARAKEAQLAARERERQAVEDAAARAAAERAAAQSSGQQQPRNMILAIGAVAAVLWLL